jgi:hypothetical protein
VAQLRTAVAQLHTDVAQLRTAMAQLRTDAAQLCTAVAQLRTDLAQLRTAMAQLRTDVHKVPSSAACSFHAPYSVSTQVQCEISGFCRDVNDVFAILACYAALICLVTDV